MNQCPELSVAAVGRLVLIPRRGTIWQQGWLLLLASCARTRVAFLEGVGVKNSLGKEPLCFGK